MLYKRTVQHIKTQIPDLTQSRRENRAPLCVSGCPSQPEESPPFHAGGSACNAFDFPLRAPRLCVRNDFELSPGPRVKGKASFMYNRPFLWGVASLRGEGDASTDLAAAMAHPAHRCLARPGTGFRLRAWATGSVLVSFAQPGLSDHGSPPHLDRHHRCR